MIYRVEGNNSFEAYTWELALERGSRLAVENKKIGTVFYD